MKLSEAHALAEQAIYDYTSSTKWQEVKYMKWTTAEMQDVIAKALVKNVEDKLYTKEEVAVMLFDISTELCWDDKDEDLLIANCKAKIEEIQQNLLIHKLGYTD